MPRPLRVFLCHASQDKPAVWKLHRYLKQHGVKPWLDREDLLPGEDWEVEIPKALFASDVILVCLSRNSVNKEGFVQKEITFALDKAMEKPEGTIFIIPVKLEDCEIPRRLSRYQWVDLSRADGRRRLLMGLNKRVTELGPDVSPVSMEETRKTPKPETNKPEGQIVSALVKEEVKEEPKKEIPAQFSSLPLDEEQREVKSTQKKPFTKLLDPSSLSSKGISQLQNDVLTNKDISKQKPMRWFGIGGIVIIALLFLIFVLNYLINNIPAYETPTVTIPPTPTLAKISPTHNLTPSTITLDIGSLFISDGVTMIYVPKGTFSMGSEVNNDEKPIHSVGLDSYYIDKYEVTNAVYKRCVDAGVCNPPKQSNSNKRSAYYGNPEFDEYPVIYADWNMANQYCSWRNARLPTEAEWEKAARGTDGRTYSWGKNIDCNKANYQSSCIGDTTKVGSYLDSVSPYGTYDMAGNVWEWVNDWYDGIYYENSPSLNPLGPDLGQSRVLRGGSWHDSDSDARTTLRFWNSPANTYFNFGFRCARSP